MYKDLLFGVAVGDALGVPVEFKGRTTIAKNPVSDMIGFGTYNLPAGTFSDDSSLTFCLAEALTKEYDLSVIAANFIAWLNTNYWTPRGHVFDVGIATREAIQRLQNGCKPELAGGMGVYENGNGSLMRILPLITLTKDMEINERFRYTQEVSSITHGHFRSIFACFYYLEFARLIIQGKDKLEVYQTLQTEIPVFLESRTMNPVEIKLFDRLLVQNIADLSENEISSSGYVLHTLEASIWCFLTTNTYEEATLKAVNLGEDTDTTGAVTGGIAGLYYGFDNIPQNWVDKMARKEDIEDLANRMMAFQKDKTC